MTAFAYQSSNQKVYYLHSRQQKLGDQPTTIFFFSLTIRDGAVPAIPRGKVVAECQNGFPILRNQ